MSANPRTSCALLKLLLIVTVAPVRVALSTSVMVKPASMAVAVTARADLGGVFVRGLRTRPRNAWRIVDGGDVDGNRAIGGLRAARTGVAEVIRRDADGGRTVEVRRRCKDRVVQIGVDRGD